MREEEEENAYVCEYNDVFLFLQFILRDQENK